MSDAPLPRAVLLAPYAAFAGFGAFWGTWGAALPSLQSRSGVSEGQLGTALLFVAVGALPAMLATGRLVDRLGTRVAAPLTVALGAAGLFAAAVADDLPSLILGMLAVGATSGATDVAINALAGQVEQRTGRPLLTRSHGVFSLFVVVSSLAGGLLLAEAGSGPALVPAFAAAATAMVVLSAAVWAGTNPRARRADPPPSSRPPPSAEQTPATDPPRSEATSGAARAPGGTLVLVVLGLVGALAYATENAHQSWGAVFLVQTFGAPVSTAALAPATFAASAALTRLVLAPVSRTHPTPLLIGGGAVAALGSVVLATSTSLPVALVGLAVAAAGTATLFPTLLSRGLRDVAPERRGRATSAVATTAYAGFLLGPAYVGLLAAAADLRVAVLGMAALAVVFAVVAAPVSRWAATRSAPAP